MATMFEQLMAGLDEVEAYLAGAREGYKVHVPAAVDVKGIRTRLKMTQSGFSDTFGFSLDAVKHWEGGRRTPEAAARAFLTVIAYNPRLVIEALQPKKAVTKRSTGTLSTGTLRSAMVSNKGGRAAVRKTDA